MRPVDRRRPAKKADTSQASMARRNSCEASDGARGRPDDDDDDGQHVWKRGRRQRAGGSAQRCRACWRVGVREGGRRAWVWPSEGLNDRRARRPPSSRPADHQHRADASCQLLESISQALVQVVRPVPLLRLGLSRVCWLTFGYRPPARCFPSSQLKTPSRSTSAPCLPACQARSSTRRASLPSA